MHLRSITTKLAAAVAGFVSLVLLVAVVGIIDNAAFSRATAEIADSYSTVSDQVVPLIRTAEAMKLDVAEVQRFLGEVSATRALDGLDGGAKLAEANAVLFRNDAVALTGIAERRNNVELVAAVRETVAGFEPYYAAGKAMAAAYVAEGPTGGSKLMNEYVAKAEPLLASLDKVLAMVDSEVKRDAKNTGSIIVAGIVRAQSGRLVIMTLAGSALVLALIVAVLLRRSVSVPVRRLSARLRALAIGQTEDPIPYADRADEIGEMAGAAGVFRNAMVARLQLERETHRERDRDRRRQVRIDGIVQAFQARIDEVLASVNDRMNAMRSSAERLSGVAEAASSEATSAETASSSASENVHSVASAAEELAASIREIASQTSRATRTATAAAETANKTDGHVSSLIQAAERIGAVVVLIRSVAHQTNLLALNATIEAGHAGESGKGFQIVAVEVKALAGQTRHATDEIATLISGIQDSTEAAVEAIRSVMRTVEEISGVTTSIAESVGAQINATNAIARSVQLASSGTLQAASNVHAMAGAIDETSREAKSVRDVSEEVVKTVGEMSGFVKQFLREVASDVEDRRKALRVPTNQLVQVTSNGGRISTIRMLDASETGCRLASIEGASAGEKVTIGFPNGPRVDGTIVWSSAGQAGIHFYERQAHLKWVEEADEKDRDLLAPGPSALAA